MSTVVADTLEGKTSSKQVDLNNLAGQISTAWVNFNGTGTVAIRDSYNVSSITDNGSGDYTVNFSTALVNTNYAPLVSIGTNNTATSSCNNLTVSGYDIFTADPALTDEEFIYSAVFGGN